MEISGATNTNTNTPTEGAGPGASTPVRVWRVLAMVASLAALSTGLVLIAVTAG